MLAVPSLTPDTNPPETLAVPAASLLHTPPPVDSESVAVAPIHMATDEGDKGSGVTFTVMVFIAEHPDAFV